MHGHPFLAVRDAVCAARQIRSAPDPEDPGRFSRSVRVQLALLRAASADEGQGAEAEGQQATGRGLGHGQDLELHRGK